MVFIIIAELRNDHKEITEKLNENIQVLHSARLAPKSSSLKDSGRWLEPAMHIIIPIDLLGESGRKNCLRFYLLSDLKCIECLCGSLCIVRSLGFIGVQ